jgi:hypothetical protein
MGQSVRLLASSFAMEWEGWLTVRDVLKSLRQHSFISLSSLRSFPQKIGSVQLRLPQIQA